MKTWSDGEPIPLYTNKIYSDYTQLQYAFDELPFVCPPSGRRHPGSYFASGTSMTLNLGEVLRGDRVTMSDYELAMGADEEARYLCSHRVDWRGVKRAQELIRDGYVAEWIVDNLPGATSFMTPDKTRKYYAAGFKIGDMDVSPSTGRPRYSIHNHVTLVIRWHRAPGRAGRRGKKVVVGFEVHPKSIEAGNRNETGLPADINDVEHGMELRIAPNSTDFASKYADSSYVPTEEEDVDDDATLTIPYTYSVYFLEEEKLEWQNRWDMYFINQEESSKVHWFAIVNSLVISGLLTSVVAVVVMRAVRGDIRGYKESAFEEGEMRLKRTKSTKSPRKSLDKGGLLDQPGDVDADGDASSDDETLEDITGWKLVHGDVFRPPAYGGLLAPIVGSGTQLVFVATGLTLLSCFGVLNPSLRGGYINCAIALFIIAGLFSGYFSGRVYKTFGGQQWRKNVLTVRMSCSRAHGMTEISLDWCAHSRHVVCYDLRPQSLRLGASLEHSDSIWYASRTCRAVAAYPATFGVCWRLVRIHDGWGMGASCPTERHPETDSAKMVASEKCADHIGRWPDPVCGRFRRVVVRLQKLVAGQKWVLPRVWLWGRRGSHSNCYCD